MADDSDKSMVAEPIEHDPEKWKPVFREIMLKQNAQAG
jgi:hypothetical protein